MSLVIFCYDECLYHLFVVG